MAGKPGGHSGRVIQGCMAGKKKKIYTLVAQKRYIKKVTPILHNVKLKSICRSGVGRDRKSIKNHSAPKQIQNYLSKMRLWPGAVITVPPLPCWFYPMYPWYLSNNAEVVKDDKVSSHRWIILAVNY